MSKVVHMTGLDPGEPVRLILRGGQEIVVTVQEEMVVVDFTDFSGAITAIAHAMQVWSANAEKGLVGQGLDPHGHPIGTYARGAGIGIRPDVPRGQFASTG